MSQHPPVKNILVADKDSDVANLFTEMLLMDSERYNVTTVLSGKECLLALKTDKPDMILLDIDLLDISGWELIDKIKEKSPDVPVIIITEKQPSLDDFSRIEKVFDYLIKPITIDGLHMAVKDALYFPYLLEKCMETIRNSLNNNEKLYILEKKYLLLKQNMFNKKRFVLMRQLYPERKLKNDPQMKMLLEDLKKQIDTNNKEIEAFKNNEFYIYNLSI